MYRDCRHPKRKSERFSAETINLLGSYILDHMSVHIDIPTPTPHEREMLSETTGKTDGQIAQWFARQKRKFNPTRVRGWLTKELGLTNYVSQNLTANFPPYGTFPRSIAEIESLKLRLCDRSIVGKRRKKVTKLNTNQQKFFEKIRKKGGNLNAKTIDVICKMLRLPLDVVHEKLGLNSDETPLQPLQYHVLKNARLNQFALDERSIRVIAGCTRLREERIHQWLAKFPKSKLSENEKEVAAEKLHKKAKEIFDGGLEKMEEQKPRLYFLLTECFKALGIEEANLRQRFQSIPVKKEAEGELIPSPSPTNSLAP